MTDNKSGEILIIEDDEYIETVWGIGYKMKE